MAFQIATSIAENKTSPCGHVMVPILPKLMFWGLHLDFLALESSCSWLWTTTPFICTPPIAPQFPHPCPNNHPVLLSGALSGHPLPQNHSPSGSPLSQPLLSWWDSWLWVLPLFPFKSWNKIYSLPLLSILRILSAFNKMQLLQRKLFYLSKVLMEGISFRNLFWKDNKNANLSFSSLDFWCHDPNSPLLGSVVTCPSRK